MTAMFRKRQEKSASKGHSHTNFNYKSYIKVSEEGKGRVLESQRSGREGDKGTAFKFIPLSVEKEGET